MQEQGAKTRAVEKATITNGERERESVGEGGKEENKRGRTRERGADLHIVGDQGTHVPDEFR